MKKLLILAIILTGCASQQVQQSFDRNGMDGFTPNCGRAQQQVDYLQGQVTAYLEYFQSRTPTLEDRRYYSTLKNNIWSLRASCSALQR